MRSTVLRSVSGWCAAFLVAVSLGGCIVETRSGDDGGGGGNHGGGGGGQTASAASSEDEAKGTITVCNSCSQVISYVHISAVEDPNWNGDQLGHDVIGIGESFSWTAPVGHYHIRCDLADGQALDTLEEYNVTAGGTTTCTVSDKH
jgi:hypothetical protein